MVCISPQMQTKQDWKFNYIPLHPKSCCSWLCCIKTNISVWLNPSSSCSLKYHFLQKNHSCGPCWGIQQAWIATHFMHQAIWQVWFALVSSIFEQHRLWCAVEPHIIAVSSIYHCWRSSVIITPAVTLSCYMCINLILV